MAWQTTTADEINEGLEAAKTPEQKRKELIAKYQKLIAEDTSFFESLLIGAGKKTHDLVEGVKEFAQGDDYQDSQFAPGEGYAALGEAHPAGVAVGEGLSEIAQLAAPGGALLKGAKYIPKLGKAAPLIADILASGGMAAVRKPGEGENRVENAGSDMLASIAGLGAIKAGSKLIDGAKLVPGARELMDKGTSLSMRHASDGGFLRGLDRAIKNFIPGVSPAMDLIENSAEKMWHMAAVNIAKLPGAKITKHGREAVNQVKEGFQEAYRAAWNQVDNADLNIDRMKDILTDGRRVIRSEDGEAMMKNMIRDINAHIKNIKKHPDEAGVYYDEIDKVLNTYLTKATSNDKTKMANIVTDAISEYRRDLPDQIKSTIAELDMKYPEVLALTRASAEAAGDIGQFSPQNLINAVKSIGGKGQWLPGKGPLQEVAEQGLRTVGRKNEISNVGGFREFVRNFPGIAPEGAVKGILDPLMGNSSTQQGLRAANKWRKGSGKLTGIDEIIGGSRLGAAFNEENKSPIKVGKDDIDDTVDELVDRFDLQKYNFEDYMRKQREKRNKKKAPIFD